MAFSRSIINATRNILGLTNRINFRYSSTTIPPIQNDQTIAEFEATTGNSFEDDETTTDIPQPEQPAVSSIHPFTIANARNGKRFGWQPTVETHALLEFDGVPFNRVDTVYVRATKNNTIVNLVDLNGTTLYSVSAGALGFKNCKKSTAIAGQAVGLAISDHIKRRGIKMVKVMAKGFGNGRLPAIKSLQMSNIQIVSITDRTPIPLPFAKPPRPPLPRRV